MFGKKKPGIQVMHYEGIESFATDYPCRLELDAEMLTVTRIKPETTGRQMVLCEGIKDRSRHQGSSHCRKGCSFL